MTNFAESDRRLEENPTLADCRRMGSTHFHYGWSCTPWGNWTDEQKAAFREGYQAAKKTK